MNRFNLAVAATAAILTPLALAGADPSHPPMNRPDHPAFTTGRAKAGIFEYTHKLNGLQVLLVPNDVAPVVTVGVVYHVGSRNEAVGYTGSTHMLEHMLFKGTPRYNKKQGTQIAATLLALGAKFNATTWYDRTNYFEQIPSDKIEVALDIESDRMRNSFIADEDRKSEMTVVRNELERGENNPANVLDEQLWAIAFREHPYHHPTIGWRSDVEGVPIARLQQFYHDFYHPDNATLMIIGNYDPATVLTHIEKYFGPIPAKKEFPPMYTVEPPQQGERRMILRRPGTVGLIDLKWHGVRALDDDFMPLNVLGNILAVGVNSRLSKALIDTGKMVSVEAGPYENRDPSVFIVSGALAPGVSHAEAEKMVRDEIARIAAAGVTPGELAAGKRQLYAGTIFARESGMAIMNQLTTAVAVGDWNYYADYLDRLKAVTAGQIQAAAGKYLVDDQLSVGWFIPEAAKETAPAAGGGGATPPGAQKLRAQPEFLKAEDGDDAEEGKRDFSADAAMFPEKSLPFGGAAARPTNYAQRVLRLLGGNGEVFLTLENHANPTITLYGRLKAGPATHPGNPVVPSMVASLLMRGTKQRTKAQLGADLEDRGISLSYSLDRLNPGDLVISGRCLKEDWPALQTALVETLRMPAFDEKEITLVRKEYEAALQREADNTQRQASIAAMREIFPAGHPFRALTVDERLHLLAAVTREQLADFHGTVYGGQTLLLAVVGDLNRETTAKGLAAAFKGWKAAKPGTVSLPPVPATRAKRVAVEMAKASTDVVMARYTGVRGNDADALAAFLANNILGGSTMSSRLGLEVRDTRGLTYGIGTRVASETLPGYWSLGVTVAPENRRKAESATREVLAKFLSEGATAQEITAAKSEFTGSFQVGLATNGGMAGEIISVEMLGLGLSYMDDYAAKVAAVTPDEINAAARKYFDAKTLVVSAAGKDAAGE